MFGNHHVGDVENVKHQFDGTGTSGLGTARRDGATRAAIVRTGHPALDAALASDRGPQLSLDVLQAGCRRVATAQGTRHDRPANRIGSVVDAMSCTPDRDGAGDTLHAATATRVRSANGRSITVRVWHELVTHGCN